MRGKWFKNPSNVKKVRETVEDFLRRRQLQFENEIVLANFRWWRYSVCILTTKDRCIIHRYVSPDFLPLQLPTNIASWRRTRLFSCFLSSQFYYFPKDIRPFSCQRNKNQNQGKKWNTVVSRGFSIQVCRFLRHKKILF